MFASQQKFAIIKVEFKSPGKIWPLFKIRKLIENLFKIYLNYLEISDGELLFESRQ